MESKKRAIFASLYALRGFAERTRNLELLDDVTNAENTAMREIFGIDLVGEPIDYGRIWANEYPNFLVMDVASVSQPIVH